MWTQVPCYLSPSYSRFKTRLSLFLLETLNGADRFGCGYRLMTICIVVSYYYWDSRQLSELETHSRNPLNFRLPCCFNSGYYLLFEAKYFILL